MTSKKLSVSRKGSMSELYKVCGDVDCKEAYGDKIKWVQCKVCKKWCHTKCVGLDDKDF